MNNLVTIKDLNDLMKFVEFVEEQGSLQNVEVTRELLQTNDFSEKYLALKKTIDQLKEIKEAVDAKISAVIVPLNLEDGTTTISSDKLNFTYCAPTTSVSVDGTKLKKEFPDVYKQCVKTSQRKGSLRVTERESNSGEENG